MDPSLPEKILFLRSISSSIINPESARLYFLKIGLIELCPAIWKKVEPFIIDWEKELERLKTNMGCLYSHDVSELQIKNAIQNLKSTKQVIPEKNNLKDADIIDHTPYLIESHFKIQNPGSMEDSEHTENYCESILGKRLNEEILIEIYNLDNKESKLL